MDFQILPVQIDGLIRIKCSGTATLQDALEGMRAISPEGTFEADLRLWDFRGCDITLSSDELREVGEVGQTLDRRTSRVAVLVDSDLNFGLMRVHEVHRESERTGFRVFRDEAEALAWLTSGEG
jgi:hypothetical protein